MPHPLSPWGPAPPSLQIACEGPVARQPALFCTFSGTCIRGQEKALSSCGPHIMGETFIDGALVLVQTALSSGQIYGICGTKMDSACLCDSRILWKTLGSALAAICIGLIKLACSTPCFPETLHHPTHKLTAAGPLPGSQPQLVLSMGQDSTATMALNSCCP